MATQHIYPTTNTRLAGQVNSLVQQLQKAIGDYDALKAVIDQISSGGNYTELATQLGYSSPAEAEIAYNLIAGLGPVFHGTPYSTPIEQVVSRMG